MLRFPIWLSPDTHNYLCPCVIQSALLEELTETERIAPYANIITPQRHDLAYQNTSLERYRVKEVITDPSSCMQSAKGTTIKTKQDQFTSANTAILGCWHISSNNAHPWPNNETFTAWLTATATLDDDKILGAEPNLGSDLPAASCSLDTYQEIPGPPLLSHNMGWASSADCQDDSLAILRPLPASSNTHQETARPPHLWRSLGQAASDDCQNDSLDFAGDSKLYGIIIIICCGSAA